MTPSIIARRRSKLKRRRRAAAVFDDGWYVTTEPILYFYAPDRVASNWHESQDFVIEINGHRFFTEKSN